jgi:hypothetical protein
LLHATIDFEIATARDAGIARREGRDMRRNLLKVKRMKAISTPHY